MKFVFSLCVLLTCSFLTSCIDLAVNESKNKHMEKTSPYQGEVYTMRGGLGGIFSKGMNRLQDTLENNYHIKASSTVWFKANGLSHSIINDYQTRKILSPIILVGHSLGANEQIKVARRLAAVNIPVALLMTVDAVSPVTVPPNVAHVVNIYRPSIDPVFSGLPLKAMDPKRTRIDNIDINTIKGIDVNHFTMDSNKKVQTLMLNQVLSTMIKKPVLQVKP